MRPTDPKDLVDPPVLIFAYTPVEDPAVYAKVWDGFIKHLEKVTGKRVQFFPVQSNAAQIEAMRAGRLHVAGFNTGATPLAVNCAGFVPFTLMSTKDGTYGYKMEIITYPGSGIDKPEDIKGKKMAFTRRDLEFRLQGAGGHPARQVQAGGRQGLRGRVLRQARQLDPRRRQQGLSGRRHRQLGAEAHDRPRRAQGRAGQDASSRPRAFRRPPTGTSTTSSRSWPRRSRRPSSRSRGRAPRCSTSSRTTIRRSIISSRSPTSSIGRSCATSTRP